MKYCTVLAAIGAAVFAGCDEKKELRVSEKILFVDRDLGDDIRVVRHVADRIEGDLLRLRTQFRNRDDEARWVDIQVSWRDAGGFELYKTNWAAFRVPAGVVVDHDIASMRADVADYEFRIRSRERDD